MLFKFLLANLVVYTVNDWLVFYWQQTEEFKTLQNRTFGFLYYVYVTCMETDVDFF